MKNWLCAVGGIALLVCGIVIGLWLTPTKHPRTEGAETVSVQDETEIVLGIDTSRFREMILAENPVLQALSEEALEVELAKRLEDCLVSCAQDLPKVIKRRLDRLGVKRCSSFVSDKSERVSVRLAAADEALVKEVEESLTRVSRLSFHLVPENEYEMVKQLLKETSGAPKGFVREGYIFRSAAEGEGDPDAPSVANFGSDLDFGDLEEPVRLIFQREKSTDGSISFVPRFIYRREQLNGGDLESAKASDGDDLMPGYCVNFSIKNGKPADKFGRMTEANKGRLLAIILDDELISSPVLMVRISKHGQIAGNFTAAEAKRLAADLNAGAMPVPLKVIAVHSPWKSAGDSPL